MAEFDINKVKGNDRFIAGGAVLLFVLSFFPWYSVSYKGSGSLGSLGTGGSVSLWGAYGIFKLAIILALLAGGIVIARLMGALDSVNLPAGVNLITLAASGLATVIFVLRLINSFHSAGAGDFKVSAHPGFGWWVGILVSAAMTYFAFLNFKSSGEQLPTQLQTFGQSTPPPPATPPGYPPTAPTASTPAPPAPPQAPQAPMTPQSNVAPPTEAIAPPQAPTQDPGYPKTGP